MPSIILEFFCRGNAIFDVLLNKNIKILLNYVVGPLIMLFLFYTVARQLQKQPHWKDSLHQIWMATTGKQQWKLYCMFGLMGVNWGLEAFKWKIALRAVQPIGFFRAFKAILAGTCIASFTPNRVGEYMGRMLFVEPGNKVTSIAPTILCSMSQMLVTLIVGTFGLYRYASLLLTSGAGIPVLSTAYFRPVIILISGITIILGLVYFRFDPMVRVVNQWLEKKHKKITLPNDYRFATMATILGISAIRYGVFIIQYFLLFSLFGIPLTGMQVFTGVSVMFVLMAMVPTLTFLTDIGFRGMAGIYIFMVFTTDTAGILAVSLGIWLINLIIPALIGSLLILRIKLFNSR